MKGTLTQIEETNRIVRLLGDLSFRRRGSRKDIRRAAAAILEFPSGQIGTHAHNVLLHPNYIYDKENIVGPYLQRFDNIMH